MNSTGVNSWYCNSTRCPLCSTEDAIRNKFVLKGFGETLKLLNTTQREQGELQDVHVPGTPTEEEINPLNAANIYIYICSRQVRALSARS